MDYTDWAKANKKRIAREFIRKVDFKPSGMPGGIFTAGLPGAGKTEFTLELIKNIDPTPLRIDMDEIARLIEGYNPQLADNFRGGASIILSRIYDEVIKNKINFVFDGTFSSAGAIQNLKRALAHDYRIKVYYIHQVPEIAWQFTKDREIIERRSIEKQGFKETYFNLRDNLAELCEMSDQVTISLVLKDEENRVGKLIENVNNNLFNELPKFLTKEELNAALL